MNESQGLYSQLVTLLVMVIIFTIIGQGVSYGLLNLAGLEMGPDLFKILNTVGERQITRMALSIGHLISFTLSGGIFLYIFHRNNYPRFLRIDSIPRNSFLYLCFFLLLFSYPLVGKIGEFNLSVPLPDWMQSSSSSAQDILKGILKMDSVGELIMSLFLVGVTPAIGEELLYRGIIQPKLQKITDNAHWGVIFAALLFSLNHFQFDRFLPFAMLGLILGYSYHYSRNLWVPIILHFINNSFQVIMLYGMKDQMEEIDFTQIPDIPDLALYISILATFGLFILLKWLSEKVFNEQELTA
jgi:membrane protease YdiL (CAAX protease family)